ncbi:hypothetical protein KDW55_14440 [Burkholderia sp. AU19243]|uniref:hypothetical protein n=1 Tax=Burkholderia TaxID=32008 RepID=UPI0008576D0A|nr:MULTISPECIES: hypothetical protein [Burkholderia]MBR8142215.1 hypothetical protein [Burkholderia vietnamiensis]AOK08075.1 hypothetical protein WK25_27020 [Burkholderia latens]MBR8364522.1 hypothetical protein [Burkholderia sp. AU19243]MBY4694722.1 hypothetical protein [Burkholderia latens]QTO50371.1 hypothetical protein J8I86_22795 [Burkholderia latens]
MKQTTVEKNRSRAHGREWFAASHFYVWLGAAAIIYFSDQLDRLFGLWILLVPLMAIPVLVAISIFVGGFIAILLARRWRRLFSVFTAPLMAIGLLMAARQFGINPDWIRFQVMRAHYSDLARNLPGPSPRYGEWSWGGTGGATGANIFYTLVYDEADKPLERATKQGREGAEFSARSYGHHFFLVTELYQ